jgi:hypothetical protein
LDIADGLKRERQMAPRQTIVAKMPTDSIEAARAAAQAIVWDVLGSSFRRLFGIGSYVLVR